MTHEMWDKVEALIEHCLSESKQMQMLVIELFLKQKSLLEVTETLDLTLQQVVALKSTALYRLRNCEKFAALIEELG